MDTLQLMANQVMQIIELRRTNAAEHVARLEAESLLSEKDMLMREGDHRLMNSLQLVQSLLALQSRNATADETKLQLDLASNGDCCILHQITAKLAGRKMLTCFTFLRSVSSFGQPSSLAGGAFMAEYRVYVVDRDDHFFDIVHLSCTTMPRQLSKCGVGYRSRR
jgi:hypothetical protein